MPRVILDAGAYAGLPQHLHIEVRPLRDPLCLEKLVLGLKVIYPLLQLLQDIIAGETQLLRGDDIGARRKDHDMRKLRLRLPAQRVDDPDPVDLIAEEFDPVGLLSLGCGKDVHDISHDPEGPAVEVHVVSIVLDLDQVPDHLVSVLALPGAEREGHIEIFRRGAQPVDAGDGGHDDHIPSLREGGHRGVSELVDLLIDVGVLLDIGVRGGDIGLRNRSRRQSTPPNFPGRIPSSPSRAGPRAFYCGK